MQRKGTDPRVALLTGARFSTQAAGGTLSYVLGLAHYLQSVGVGVHLITNGPPEHVPQGCTPYPVGKEFQPSTRRFHRALRHVSLTEPMAHDALLHLQRPDDLWYLTRVGRLPPAICTLHGDAVRSIGRRYGRTAARYYQHLESRMVARFRLFVAVDEGTAEAYRSRYPSVRNRMEVIPTAVDSAFFEGNLRGKHDERNEDLVFLYAGRLSMEKRIDSIIGSFRHSGPLDDAKLIVAGSGPEEVRLRKAARHANVEFLGPVPREKMPALYRRADALVLASEYEGAPTVALEALTCGCPVVGLPTCGLRQEMSRDGVFIAGSLDEIPQMLRAAAARRATNPPITLSPMFTWAEVGKALLRVYRRANPRAFDGCGEDPASHGS